MCLIGLLIKPGLSNVHFVNSNSVSGIYLKSPKSVFGYSDLKIILFYPITLEGRQGTTDEFATFRPDFTSQL